MQFNIVNNLSGKVLATWSSSARDGFSVPSGAGWPWTLETKLSAINGPNVLHVSTSGHNTDSKESLLARSKVERLRCHLLVARQPGVGNATTGSSAQTVVDSSRRHLY